MASSGINYTIAQLNLTESLLRFLELLEFSKLHLVSYLTSALTFLRLRSFRFNFYFVLSLIKKLKRKPLVAFRAVSEIFTSDCFPSF